MKKIPFLIAIIVVVLSCAEKKPAIDSKKLYKQNCVICHGVDGKLGLNNSKDLTASKLSLDERISIIKNGKNTMTPFSGILNPDQIKAVAAYTFQLK